MCVVVMSDRRRVERWSLIHESFSLKPRCCFAVLERYGMQEEERVREEELNKMKEKQRTVEKGELGLLGYTRVADEEGIPMYQRNDGSKSYENPLEDVVKVRRC